MLQSYKTQTSDLSQDSDLLEQIDRLCLHFEDTWKKGPAIEDYLQGFSGAQRQCLLLELLHLDYYYNSKAKTALLAEYRVRFPEDANIIDELIADDEDTLSLIGGSSDLPETNNSSSESAKGLGCNYGGQQLGPYVLLEKIGEGAEGPVFRAQHCRLGVERAVKTIHAGQFASEKDIQRFYLAAEATAALDHANILPLYEVGEDRGQHYLGMKLMRGGSLNQRIKESTSKERSTSQYQRQIAQLMIKVCRAVQFAHQRGVLHRDLKPGNILLDEHGEPIVTDLGLSTRLEGIREVLPTGKIVGTAEFMPPEQARGDMVSVTADVYSLGATLYQALTGHPPFQGNDPLAVLEMVKHDPVPSPWKWNAGLDRRLVAICNKCLQKRPEDRYSSAEDLALDLEAYLFHQRGKAWRTTIGDSVRSVFTRETPAYRELTASVGVGNIILGLVVIAWGFILNGLCWWFPTTSWLLVMPVLPMIVLFATYRQADHRMRPSGAIHFVRSVWFSMMTGILMTILLHYWLHPELPPGTVLLEAYPFIILFVAVGHHLMGSLLFGRHYAHAFVLFVTAVFLCYQHHWLHWSILIANSVIGILAISAGLPHMVRSWKKKNGAQEIVMEQ